MNTDKVTRTSDDGLSVNSQATNTISSLYDLPWVYMTQTTVNCT